jgi:hypothetical protein
MQVPGIGIDIRKSIDLSTRSAEVDKLNLLYHLESSDDLVHITFTASSLYS